MRWLWFLIPFILVMLLTVAGILIVPQAGLAAESFLPITPYHSALVPDFTQLTFSDFPVLQQGGTLQVSEDEIAQLGYNPSRTWQSGTPLGEVLMLGDTQSTFGLQSFSLSQIAQRSGLDLSQLSLSNFPLLKQQTIATLVKAIPTLGNLPLVQVKPLADLVTQNLSHLALDSLNLRDWGGDIFRTPLSAIAISDPWGELPLGDLPLEHYSFTQIPALDQVPLSNFKGWQTTTLQGVPGLTHIPLTQLPLNPFQIAGAVAIHDVTYGGDLSHKESRQTPTQFSITGSDRVGFHYNCTQPRGCDYLELNSPGYAGLAGNDPTGLHGARWIRGGSGNGEQMVPGGYGILGQLNGGMEPTGRLPFGPVFKVVLTETDEATGTGQFSLYFRVCIHELFVDLGCTPYFIGPVPFLTSHEKGFVFIGMMDGSGGIQELPPGVELPPDVQQQVDQIKNQYGGNAGGDSSNPSELCGSLAGVDFNALAVAISSIEGGYSSAGQWGCDGDGNCGRGLGRYQFMSYRDDAKAAILRQPGGAEFLARANINSNDSDYLGSLEQELPKYFPPAAQDAVFKQAMAQAIKSYQSQGMQGDALLACLGESWYSGECSHSSRGDYTGGPSVQDYGQRTANAYDQALKRYGAKPCSGQPGVSTGKLLYPLGTSAPITGTYGEDRGDHIHAGVDFAMPIGTPIKAADGGTVVDACIGCDPAGYGSLIQIRHANGLETWYAHVDTITVKIGDAVAKGQVIGTVGDRGDATGPHLHFEVHQGGSPVDPMPYLNRN